MHINFDDESAIVSNLQIFLKEEVDPMLILSGCYDLSTHEALVKYLKTPNTADYIELKNDIISNFTYKESLAPFTLIDGGGIYSFDVESTPERLRWYTRPTQAHYNNGVTFVSDHIDELSTFCRNRGWTVTSFSYNAEDDTNSGRNRVEIIIERTGIINRFPNDEVLPMVNLFTGKYAYKRCISSSSSFEGFMTFNEKYKVAYIPCEPGDTFTLAHGFAIPCEMAAGYVTCSEFEIKKENTYVEGIKNRMASNGGEVDPGDYFYYEIPEDSDATFLLVQLPYRENMTVTANETTSIILGDVNQDGVIDGTDVSLLDAYVTAVENGESPPIVLEGNALIAANVTRNVDLDGNPIISRDDVTVLQKAVESGDVSSLGTYEYQQAKTISQFELDRLLVMSGELSKDESLHVPVATFWTNPWAVHQEFIEYFLDRVIHKYSDVNDIAWLQKNVQILYPNYRLSKLGKYDSENDYLTGDFIKRNNLSGNWEYFRDGVYTGYFMDSNYDLTNGVFRREDKVYTDLSIRNGRMYSDGNYDGRIVLSNGNVAKENAKYSLKACIQDFQNKTITAEANANVLDDKNRYWTLGYYDVSTDETFIKTIGNDQIHNVSAFR